MGSNVTFTLVVTKFGHAVPAATIIFDVDGDGGIVGDVPVDMVPKAGEPGTLEVTIACKIDDPKGLFYSVNVGAKAGAHCELSIRSGAKTYTGSTDDMTSDTGWWLGALV